MFGQRPDPAAMSTPPDLRPRRARPQPERDRRGPAAQPARGHHGTVGIRQVVARLRHDLRRGAAALRRVALGVRPPVPRADGEAGRRLDRGPVAGPLDRAEDDRRQPAVDGGDGDGDLRLPPPALREHRRRALPALRPRDHVAGHRPDRGAADDVSARHADQCPGARRPRPQGRVQEGSGRLAPAGIPQGPRRRPDAIPRGRHRARAAPQPLDRDRRRSPDREARHRAAPDRLGRDRPSPRRGRGPHQHPRRGRPAVLPDPGVRGLRPEHPGDVAAGVLLQLAARRVPRLPGPGRPVGFRSRTHRARPLAVDAGGRHRAVGRGRFAPGEGGRGGARPQLRHRRHGAVRQAAEAREGPAALTGRRRRRLPRRARRTRTGRGSRASSRTCAAATSRRPGSTRPTSSAIAPSGRARAATASGCGPKAAPSR